MFKQVYEDVFGSEIKVGHVIAVGRYGRSSSLEVGIVTKIIKTKKSAWVYFGSSYNNVYYKPAGWRYGEAKAQLGKNNSNITIASVPDGGTQSLNKAMVKLIADGILPSDYVLGQPIEMKTPVVDTTVKVLPPTPEASKIEDVLSGLGAPKSLGGSK